MHSTTISRITYFSNPLYPATIIPWDSIPYQPAEYCECDRTSRESTYLSAHANLNYRGSHTYTVPTPTGNVIYNTRGIGNFDENGTNGALELSLAGGFVLGDLRLGLMTGVIPSDGSMFIPVALQGVWDFGNAARLMILGHCPNAYLNVGIPLDFETGAPMFANDLRRQRKFLSGGLGFERAMSDGMNFSFRLGAEWLTIPMDEIECCPGIDKADRHPGRSMVAAQVGLGLTF